MISRARLRRLGCAGSHWYGMKRSRKPFKICKNMPRHQGVIWASLDLRRALSRLAGDERKLLCPSRPRTEHVRATRACYPVQIQQLSACRPSPSRCAELAPRNSCHVSSGRSAACPFQARRCHRLAWVFRALASSAQPRGGMDGRSRSPTF